MAPLMNMKPRRYPNNYISKKRFLEILRAFTSISFFSLGFLKIVLFIKYGNEPYINFVQVTGLPESFKYYGILAFTVELFLAVSVWLKRTFRVAVFLMIGLASMGMALSIYSLAIKLRSECGCGLLGNNEFGLLFQKLIIIVVLMLLLKNRNVLFVNTRP